MEFDSLYNPYQSKRNVVYGKRGMVATSQPFAAEAGFEMLKKGGNAIDAAIATASCLTVCEPTSNGIGGDAFAIIWTQGKLHGLNSSGPSPKRVSLELAKKQGYKEMPRYGWLTVTVPGVPAAWAELSEKFGKLSLETVLAPAIKYAEEGYPVTPTLGRFWKNAYNIFKEDLKADEFKHWFQTFTKEGRAPEIGELITLKYHAKTLKEIAETKAESFYKGEIAEKIDKFSKETGGYLRKEDLEKFKPEWVNPISVNYRGYDVYEIPPNGQGIVALMALNILKGFEFKEKDCADTYHKQMEAIKLAFEDAFYYIGEPKKMKIKIEDLLSDAYAEEKRRQIEKDAFMPKPNRNGKGGTVYLATADGEGNMVSYIQSNYMSFGSGLVVPETGIAFHNRGNSFSLDENHINVLEAEKRPFHTIIPGFLMKDNKPIGPFGIMGGPIQPQAHVQVLMNCIDFKLNPQAALDAPRWLWEKEKDIMVEPSFPECIADSLKRKGHNVNYGIDIENYGRGQIIWKDNNGILAGGTEWRTDGTIYSW